MNPLSMESLAPKKNIETVKFLNDSDVIVSLLVENDWSKHSKVSNIKRT